MGAYGEDDLLALSGIQHYAFCRRQWALIHIEQQWAENVLTFEGRQLHRRADDPYICESRGDVLITRAMPLVSYALGFYGVADVVEFHAAVAPSATHTVRLPRHEGWWIPFPVEYKRGKPKADDWDELQLCAQAMALEEMLGVAVEDGALFYGERERRVQVTFHAELRDKVRALMDEMHRLFQTGQTPLPKYASRCKSCSLLDICLPKLKADASRDYLQKYLQKDTV